MFAKPLREHYDLAISAFYGLEGDRIDWQGTGITVYPGLGGEFGGDYVAAHAADHFGGDVRGGLVFSLMDIFMLDPAKMARVDWMPWVPIDHDPLPDGTINVLAASDAVPLAMSRFGEGRLREAGFDPLYCPHAVDLDVMKRYDRDAIRDHSPWPKDAFLVGMVAANKGRPSRKNFQQAFEAFRLLALDRDDVYLYVHSVPTPQISGGEDLRALVAGLGLDRKVGGTELVTFADEYRQLFKPARPEMMAGFYSAMDVLLNPASGEGFGIPCLEAQACGTPVVVTDFSAMSEVCGAGWKVFGRPYWTGANSWMRTPDVEDTFEALKQAYGLPEAQRKQLRGKAREHASQYALPKVLSEFMLPALEEARSRLARRRPVDVPVAA